ncbi:MAG: DNA-binding protein [Bacteroides sp.]
MAKKETNQTKSYILRMDSSLMEAVEKWAADEFRSTNGQLQWIITEALRKKGRLRKGKNAPRTDESEEETP